MLYHFIIPNIACWKEMNDTYRYVIDIELMFKRSQRYQYASSVKDSTKECIKRAFS